jgi:RNA polymerase sigma factor (sigma-70 family)
VTARISTTTSRCSNKSKARRPAPRGRRKREDTTHPALMTALNDEKRTLELKGKVCANGRARYGLQLHDAEDIFHDAVLTYLGIHTRFGDKDNHFGLLVGIFHKKALEFLGRQDRQTRVARRFVSRLQANKPAIARGEDPKGAAVERVIRDEDAALIRNAIGGLDEEHQELLLDLAEGRVSRLEMIDRLGINRNTFDSRLRTLRLKLKAELEESGVLA